VKFYLDVLKLIIQLLHEQTSNSVLMLTSSCPSLLLLLEFLEKAALRFKFVHLILTKFICEALIANVA